MKSKKILLGSLGATLVAAAVLFASTSNDTGVYQSRVLNTDKHAEGIAGAFEYYNLIKKNNITGEFDGEAYSRAKSQVDVMALSSDRAEMVFLDQGPDNVGGRTRAILIDKDNYNIVYAGSVSGGLFKSVNRGATWKKVEGYTGNYGISSMCQTANGHIYVATGHSEDRFFGGTGSGMNGEGVYVSTDNGETFTQVSGTASNQWINEVVALGNSVLIAGEDGLKKYDGTTLSDFTSVNGGCAALAISPDEQVIVADMGNHKTYISTDGGANFTDVSGSETNGLIPSSGVGRMEYAISHEKLDGKYTVYASQSTGSGALKGVFYTANYGDSWSRIAPANNGYPGAFAPFGSNRQGNYNQIITVVKGDPEQIIFGGIEVYAKSVIGNWELRSNGFVPQLNPIYVHSDQHEMQWDSEGRLWIGNDGGVFYSDDNGETFRESNRGYNVTQFYGISASAHGDVMGGAQDNGTQVNYHDNHTYREHDQFSGGDGFTCAMSFINRDIAFSTIYYGLVYRSGDRGFNVSQYSAANLTGCTPGDLLTGGCGSFYTSIELYENPNDLNSQDSVIYPVTRSYSAGEVVQVPSATSQQFMPFTLTEDITFDDTLLPNPSLTISDTIVKDTAGGSANINLYGKTWSFVTGTWPITVGDVITVEGESGNIVVGTITYADHYFGTNANEPGEVVDMGANEILQNVSWDTVVVQDVYQSWLALGLGNGEGLWLTRNALRFSATHDGFIQAGGGMSGSVTDMEFSKDGDHLYVGTSSGRLYRLSGLADKYSPNPVLGSNGGNIEDSLINWNHPNTQTTFEEIGAFGAPILGINVDRDDPDLVVIALGGFGGASKVRKSTNATQASPSFNSIAGNLPDMPCLSILMDRDDPNQILVGTEFGLFRTENGGTSWAYVDAPFGKTAIFDLMQNWRSWDEGCYATGQVYVGTHGRGIWSTNEFLSVSEAQDNIKAPEGISNLSVYPNPVVVDANITFDMNAAGKGTIRVYNLNGQVVVDMPDVSLNAGKNNIALGFADLSKGTYIVKLTTAEDSKTAKFIKQ